MGFPGDPGRRLHRADAVLSTHMCAIFQADAVQTDQR
jgi:hypothetical protein